MVVTVAVLRQPPVELGAQDVRHEVVARTAVVEAVEVELDRVVVPELAVSHGHLADQGIRVVGLERHVELCVVIEEEDGRGELCRIAPDRLVLEKVPDPRGVLPFTGPQDPIDLRRRGGLDGLLHEVVGNRLLGQGRRRKDQGGNPSHSGSPRGARGLHPRQSNSVWQPGPPRA